MGQRAKWLQDERYIRIAGAMLMVSPFLNYFSSVTFNNQNPDKWALKQLIAGFMIASGLSWLGRISNFLVGFLMFRGKSSAWVPVLAILGFTIAKNLITFKTDFQTNRFQTVGGLVVNIFLFILVFESEYRLNKELNKRIKAAQLQRSKNQSPLSTSTIAKNNLEKKTTEKSLSAKKSTDELRSTSVTANIQASSPSVSAEKNHPTTKAPSQRKQPQSQPNLKSKAEIKKKEFLIQKGTPIDFDGHGKIAEVFHCTEKELWLKVTNHLPSDIHKKTIKLEAPGNKGHIRLKFSRLRDDSTLIFKVIT